MTLDRLDDPELATRWCADARDAGTLGFVPTMGALHAGHLELVRAAVRENDQVCVSIFVNPLQFDDAQDLDSYPRDFEADAALLDAEGCALVFTGTLARFFPETESSQTIVLRDAGPGAIGLEGEHRPGHFAGVATIVGRLFELVQPTRAYFGEKDFQQTLVVRHVARRLRYPEIRVIPTSREPHGLARSSRNARLSPGGREAAGRLSRALFEARSAWERGVHDVAELEAVLAAALASPEIDVEYAAVRDSDDWTAARPAKPLAHPRALVAASIDGVRLIDNLALRDA
ncbi:MAG: pantoate--beta-alanine ligase [Deltaproteobacteria bacterium]|nr:pantoate--beta-alanine ligase [Deltaproteobacteria bacterium]